MPPRKPCIERKAEPIPANPWWFADSRNGITLRDQFAMAALVGMMQSMRPYSNDYERSAKDAYTQADAMLAAREKTS